MAFWGIEVKPGRPFIHSSDSDRVKGRLRMSQATLGIGSSTIKSLLQCNIGDRSPVFLCALLPDKTESCHLELEFDEADDIIFSVIGPRSVHLTGYYLASGGHSNPQDDDSESYGVDIANTETEESNCSTDDDEYEDSFINDGELEVSPPSPLSKGRGMSVATQKMLYTKKPKPLFTTTRRRLKKKYQSIVSDDDNTLQQNIMVSECKGVSGIESEEEDKFPISSLYKGTHSEAGDKVYQELSKTGDKKTEDDGFQSKIEVDGTPMNDPICKADGVGGPERPCMTDQIELETHRKSEKGKKERLNGGKSQESDGVNHDIALKGHKPLEDKAGDHKPATDKEMARVLPYTEAGSENGSKPKKRRKEQEGEGKPDERRANYNYEEKQLDEDGKQHEGKTCKNGKDHSFRSEQDKMFSNDERIDIDSNQMANGDQSQDKKTKKKKKRRKNLENGGNIDIDAPPLSVEEKNKPFVGFEDKNMEEKSSQGRTLSNGLIIVELEAGKPDGKIAAPRKKVKVLYIGKLRETGLTFDSNIGKAPFKFRLGAEDVIEGWNIGLDGMRVGDKRRLTIPPTMGYGSQGDGENIPPNSWLVYEVELVSVSKR